MDSFAKALYLNNEPELASALKYLAWFGLCYLAFIVVYSIFYWRYVSKLETEFVEHVFWWLKHSAIWYFFAPCCLVFFTRQYARRALLINFVLLGLPLIVIAVLVQITFDYGYIKDDFSGYFVLFLPRHAGIFAILCVYWLLFVGNKKASKPHLAEQASSPALEQAGHNLAYLELEHLGRPYKLELDLVWLIKSAGNYVEIDSEQGQFIKRASLKQLQHELPEHFYQCHRSYIVNLRHISAVQKQSSGHAVAVLNNGAQVNISKRYKNAMKVRLAEVPPLAVRPLQTTSGN